LRGRLRRGRWSHHRCGGRGALRFIIWALPLQRGLHGATTLVDRLRRFGSGRRRCGPRCFRSWLRGSGARRALSNRLLRGGFPGLVGLLCGACALLGSRVVGGRFRRSGSSPWLGLRRIRRRSASLRGLHGCVFNGQPSSLQLNEMPSRSRDRSRATARHIGTTTSCADQRPKQLTWVASRIPCMRGSPDRDGTGCTAPIPSSYVAGSGRLAGRTEVHGRSSCTGCYHRAMGASTGAARQSNGRPESCAILLNRCVATIFRTVPVRDRMTTDSVVAPSPK